MASNPCDVISADGMNEDTKKDSEAVQVPTTQPKKPNVVLHPDPVSYCGGNPLPLLFKRLKGEEPVKLTIYKLNQSPEKKTWCTIL